MKKGYIFITLPKYYTPSAPKYSNRGPDETYPSTINYKSVLRIRTGLLYSMNGLSSFFLGPNFFITIFLPFFY